MMVLVIFIICCLYYLVVLITCMVAEMEKRKNIAQTQILDQKIAQITRNSRHIIIHVKRA